MTDTTTEVLRKRVIRERETEQRLRAMDTHELVALLHSLEDERDALAQERDALLTDAQGHARDARHAESVADAWKKRAEELAEKADKFMWQVRDTCTRAEKAEAERDAARAEVERLRAALEMIAGRRQCVDNLLSNQAIARIALDEPSAALAAKGEA